MILKIAFRNIFLHKVRTIVFGFILIFATFLAILGNSFVDAISNGMKKSLTNSITGDIQIYSQSAPDHISLFGSSDGNIPDIGFVNNFQKVNEILTKNIPEIKTIVPMGMNQAMFNPGNLLDIKLNELREFKKTNQNILKIESLKNHIKVIIERINEDLKRNPEDLNFILENNLTKSDVLKNLQTALSNEFWKNFDEKYEEKLEFLSNKIAPLIVDDSFIYFAYLGTIPSVFKKAFPLFEIVKGTEIPDGKRGFLFSDFVYENMVKHKVAKRLDEINNAILKGKQSINNDEYLKNKVLNNRAQAAEIFNQLNPEDTQILIKKLQNIIPSTENKIQILIDEFLNTNDSNFIKRYKFFYDEIAPHITLYRIKIGDIFPVTVFGKSGSVNSVNMKVYGTYRFKSFEKSLLASNFCLMDLISFRDLYGFLSLEKKSEIQSLEEEMGLIPNENQNTFFSKEKSIKSESIDSKKSKINLNFNFNRENRTKIFENIYSNTEFEKGPFINAAVILKNSSEINKVISKIDKLSVENNLEIKATDWRTASGTIGQLTIGVRIVLFAVIFIIFLVAAFIMMNSILMTTMERTVEIGTMRAIGAQKKFILKMIFSETIILNIIFGLAGSILALIVICIIQINGIPAYSQVATFFFSGDRLYLNVNFLHIVFVWIGIFIVSLISTYYPAIKAMNISPIEALRKRD